LQIHENEGSFIVSQMPGDQEFVHRQNRDGSFDSICTNCFQTVANKKVEAELEQIERDHICEGHKPCPIQRT
jgi:hypothetical protein